MGRAGVALGKLLEATAYEVAPGQTSGFQGGLVDNLQPVEEGLAQAAGKGRLETGLPVSLRLDGDRTSIVRDAVMAAAFRTQADFIRASVVLAERLGNAMDGRSDASLLVVSVHEQPKDVRQVVTWIFPKGTVIRRSGTTVDLEEAFIINSRLRKAALLAGTDSRAGFLTARVLDYQTTAIDRKVADFWITEFLDARLQMNSAEGTSRLAGVLRQANDKMQDHPEHQEILHTAIAAVRTSPQQRLSIRGFATNFLPEGPAREAVLKATKSDEEATSIFDLDVPRFDRLVQYHIYTLANGIRVSAPFVQIGEGVQIEETEDGRILSASGKIEEEKIRANG